MDTGLSQPFLLFIRYNRFRCGRGSKPANSPPPSCLAGDGLVTMAEASVVVAALHMQRVLGQCAEAADYLEHLLRAQLVAAVGRVVTPDDFGQYMAFHYRRLFRLPRARPRTNGRGPRYHSLPGDMVGRFCACEHLCFLYKPVGCLTLHRQTPPPTPPRRHGFMSFLKNSTSAPWLQSY